MPESISKGIEFTNKRDSIFLLYKERPFIEFPNLQLVLSFPLLCMQSVTRLVCRPWFKPAGIMIASTQITSSKELTQLISNWLTHWLQEWKKESSQLLIKNVINSVQRFLLPVVHLGSFTWIPCFSVFWGTQSLLLCPICWGTEIRFKPKKKKWQLYKVVGKTMPLGSPLRHQLLHYTNPSSSGCMNVFWSEEISTYPCTWGVEADNDVLFSLVKYFLHSQHILVHITFPYFIHLKWEKNKALYKSKKKKCGYNLNILAHRCPKIMFWMNTSK